MAAIPITPSDDQAFAAIVDIKSEDLVMVGQAGLAGAEAATIEAHNGIGFTQIAVDSVNLSLTVADNIAHLRGPGKYRISKPDSAGTAHLFIYPPTRAIVDVTADE